MIDAIRFKLIKYRHLSVFVYGLVTFLLIFPDVASANPGTSSNAIETVFCNVIVLFTGGTGKAIASVGVIAFGIGALLGKTSWGMGFTIATGIALIFGASSVVNVLTGNGGASFCSTIGVYTLADVGGPPGDVPAEDPDADPDDDADTTPTDSAPPPGNS